VIEERTERPAFGALLRKRRIAARLSQEQLAERARISVQAVSALERGARRSPRPDTLALLIRTLELEGVEVAEFEATARAAVVTRVRNVPVPDAREFEGAAPPQWRVPVSETSFIGRAKERRAIERALAAGRCVTLWGPGGVGKTRLALEALSSLSAPFGERVAFVALASAIDMESVVRAIAAAYDLADGEIPTLIAHLAARFTDARVLLVLDNCEHVVEHVSHVVATMLAQLPSLSILATSREPLRIDGEEVVRVGALAVQPDAVTLFLDRARTVSGIEATSPGDLASVATICRRLDGLPLALELAAARTRSMSIGEIEGALDERFALLTRGNRTLDRRQRTLRDTIAWSYELLPATSRIVFERLALLNGAFAIEHAVAIAADARIDRWAVVDAVADLIDKALVTFASEQEDDERGHPYTILESTRVYANTLDDRERADHDRDGAQRRFGSWLLARARESYDSFYRQSELIRDGIDIAHLRGYLRFAIDGSGDVPTAATIVGTLMHWWIAVGLASEGLRWIDAALAKLDSTGDDLRPRIYALIGKTSLLRAGSFFKEASAPTLEAHACALRLPAIEPEDRRLLARTAFMASESAAVTGRHEEAEALIGLTLGVYTELGDEFGIALAVFQAGFVARLAGDLQRCRESYHASMTYFERQGYRRLEAHTRNNLADVDYALGNVAAAVENARSSTEVILEISSAYYMANSLSNLASYLPDVGAIDEAAEAASRALDIAREGGFDRFLARVLQSCATVAVLRGRDPADATALFGYSIPRVGEYNGNFTELRREDRLRTLLSERLTPDALESAMRRGHDLDDDEALRLARAALT
jgi:predicted ATPase/transcriptional regulator with XRE-family HTH domain